MKRLILIISFLMLMSELFASGVLLVQGNGRNIHFNNAGYSTANFTHMGAHDWGLTNADHSRFHGGANARVYRLLNNGTAPVHISHVYLSGNTTDFNLVPPSVTVLHPGQQTTFRVMFTPRTSGFGAKNTQVHIYANGASNVPVVWAGNRIFKMNLRGNAIKPRLWVGYGSTYLPDGYNSPGANVTDITHLTNEANRVDWGRFRNKSVRVTNTSPYKMRIDFFINGRNDNLGHPSIHRLGANSFILNPGQTIYVPVRFYGNRMGKHGAWVNVKPNSCPFFNHDVAFYGKTGIPRISVYGPRNAGAWNMRARVRHAQNSDFYDGTDYGNVWYGHEHTFRVFNENRLYNPHGALVTHGEFLQRVHFYGSRISMAGHWAPDFQVTQNLPGFLDPMQNATFKIKYKPRGNNYVAGGHWCWVYIWMNGCPAPNVFQVRAHNLKRSEPGPNDDDIEVRPVTDKDMYMQALEDGGIEIDFDSAFPTEATMEAEAAPYDTEKFTGIILEEGNEEAQMRRAEAAKTDKNADHEIGIQETAEVPAGISENMKLFPNPANAGFVNVEIPSHLRGKKVELRLISSSGQEIKTIRTDEFASTVRVNHQAAGLFLIRLIADGKCVETKKVVFE